METATRPSVLPLVRFEGEQCPRKGREKLDNLKTPALSLAPTVQKDTPTLPRKSHFDHICDEYERVVHSRRRRGHNDPGTNRGELASGKHARRTLDQRRASLRTTYLTLPQILAFRNADDLLPVDISHLGVLWVTDRDHDGRITLEDLFFLVEFCKDAMKSSPSRQQHEREAMIQSICTETLWESVRLDRERFVEWVSSLVYEASTQRRRFWRHGSHVYVETAAVESLHRFLRMKDYGVEFQGFVDLLQRVGESEGLMDLFDEEQDDYVVLGVVKEWVRGVYVGATRLLADVAN